MLCAIFKDHSKVSIFFSNIFFIGIPMYGTWGERSKSRERNNGARGRELCGLDASCSSAWVQDLAPGGALCALNPPSSPFWGGPDRREEGGWGRVIGDRGGAEKAERGMERGCRAALYYICTRPLVCVCWQ